MNIKEVLAGGIASGLKNSKHLRALQCLRWRQLHQGQESLQYCLDGDGTCITLRQIPNGEMKGLGTGTFVWPAAIVLAKYFEKIFSNGDLQGKRVCELGSGVGLNGIVAALLGAATVVLTDQDTIIPVLKENLAQLKESLPDARLHALQVAPYDWNSSFGAAQDGQGKQEQSPADFDILIVSDCVLPKLYPIALLVQAVKRLMTARTVAYFSYEHRPFPDYDPRQEFVRLCELEGLCVTVIPLDEHHSSYCADDIELWTVRVRTNTATVPHAETPLRCLTWGDDLPEVRFEMDGQLLQLRQSKALGEGGVVWPTAVVLSRLLLRPRGALAALLARLPAGSAALDLGAGCGLTSLALQSRGLAVVATDRAALLPLLAENTRGGRPRPAGWGRSVQVQACDWAAETAETLGGRRFPLVLCSDCLYASCAVDALLQTLLAVTGEEAVVVLANELRTALEEFLYLLRRWEGVHADVAEVEVSDEDLAVVRSAQSFAVAPPVRVLALRLRRTPRPAGPP